MKTNHAPREAGIVVRLLAYSVVFLALVGVRESLRESSGPFSRTAGAAYGKVMSLAAFR